MSTQLVVFGIQAVLRAAQAGADLYKEHARDRQVFLPNLELPEGSRAVQLQTFLKANADLAVKDPVLANIWDAEDRSLTTSRRDRVDEAYAVMLQHKARVTLVQEGRGEQAAEHEAAMLAAGRMVEQWRDERKPPSALVRMALTLTDIGLEYVSSDPSILGVGSRGEKLIVAFALKMSDLIPNEVDAFGARTDFADRVLGIFLRAGLGTLSSNSSIVFRNEDVARLMEGVTKPIVDALPENIADQVRYRDLIDALAGPSAVAAFELLADNTQSYLGKRFADDRALGAVTTALFREIQSVADAKTIADVFSEQGLIRLYQAGLGVAVDRPELFIDETGSPKSDLYRELLRGAASTFRAHPRFEGPVGASLAAMAVTAVGSSAPALLKLDPGQPWEKIAVTLIEQISVSLSAGLQSGGALAAFDDEQLLELARLVLVQVADTPGMLGVNRTEVQSIVAGIAEAMANDDNLLLSADEWLAIAALVAERAAANPGRLFGLSPASPEGALAVGVMKSILTVATGAWTAAGRSGRPVLFGATLEAAMEAALDALAGPVTGLAQNTAVLGEFVQQILDAVAADPEKFGSEGFLKVLRALINEVFASGALPTPQDINNALEA
jgi:hypothetical protein